MNRIVRQIAQGKWIANGDAIKISEDGRILDGQHRLWAVIEAKRSIPVIIVRGISRPAFATIDTLRKPRSGGDVLALNGVIRYSQRIASALKWGIYWERGVIEENKNPINQVENSDIEEAHGRHPTMGVAVERAMKLSKLMNGSVLGFFYYVLNNRNPELAERFMTALERPVGLEVTHPFYLFRDYLIQARQKEKRQDALVVIALMIKVVNAAHRNREIKVLKWVNQGNSKEKFPILDVGNGH